MIKKARDIQLGDRIGGRVIAHIKRSDDDGLKVYLYFADVLHLGGHVKFAGEHDVWVDDPDTMLPVLYGDECCKPTIVTKEARDVKPEDILCLRVRDAWEDGDHIHVSSYGGSVCFYLGDRVKIVEGGDDCTNSNCSS